MRRSSSSTSNMFGTSFLDVLANTIGGLTFLLVLAVIIGGKDDQPPPPPPVRICSPETLPAACVGKAYEVALCAEGGVGYYAWTPSTPISAPGLDLSQQGSLAGIPSAGGRFALSVQVSDSMGVTARSGIQIEVLDVCGAVDPLVVKTQSLPDAVSERSFRIQLSADGGLPPYSWASVEGGGPEWLRCSDDGACEGTPPQPGIYTARLRVLDRVGSEAVSATITGTVLPPPKPLTPLEIRTRSLAKARVGEPVQQALAGKGGVEPYSWTAAGLPDGLRLEGDQLVGVPTQTGESSVALGLIDADDRSAEARLTIDVEPALLALRVLSERFPDAVSTRAYEMALAAEGGLAPYAWSIVEGALPAGVEISEFRLTGVPETAGRFAFQLGVSDARGESAVAATSQSIVVLRSDERMPLELLTRDVPGAIRGEAYTLFLTATGGSPPYMWEADGLPEGLSIQDGRVTGTPLVHGRFGVRLRVLDGVEAIEGEMALEVRNVVSAWWRTVLGILLFLALAILAVVLLKFMRFQINRDELERLRAEVARLRREVEQAPSANEVRELRERVDELRKENEELARRAEEAEERVEEAEQTREALEKLIDPERQPAQLEILTSRIPNARAGAEYAVQLACQGGVPPYVWKLVEGELPPGLELDADGEIRGVPFEGLPISQSTEYPITVEVVDALSDSSRKEL